MQKDYVYPEIGDRDTPDNWLEAGGKSAAEVAHLRAKELLASHHPTHVSAANDAVVRDRWNIVVERP